VLLLRSSLAQKGEPIEPARHVFAASREGALPTPLAIGESPPGSGTVRHSKWWRVSARAAISVLSYRAYKLAGVCDRHCACITRGRGVRVLDGGGWKVTINGEVDCDDANEGMCACAWVCGTVIV
jgi:hypothetical protein